MRRHAHPGAGPQRLLAADGPPGAAPSPAADGTPPAPEAPPGSTPVRQVAPRPPLDGRRALRLGLLATGLLGLAAVGFVLSALVVLSRSLPEIRGLADYRPPMASALYDRDGELLQRYFRERRTVVPFDRIPLQVRQAFLAAEDAGFYQHQGLDYLAIARAALDELLYRTLGGRRSGGSTITQQTAKTFFLSAEQTYTRKLREWLLAKRIEDACTKDEILYLYLNQIYFGHGAYGVEEAARTYYGKGVVDLSLGEATALAAVPKAPTRINPFANARRTAERRDYVLQQMLEQGWISDEAATRARQEPVRSPRASRALQDAAAYPAEVIRRELESALGTTTLLEGGLRIYSTLDARLQQAAQEALQRGLREVDKRQGYRGPLLRLEPDERKALEPALRAAFAADHPDLPAADDLSRPLLGRAAWDLSGLEARQVAEHPGDAAEAVPSRLLAEDLLLGGLVTAIDSSEHLAQVDLGAVVARLPLREMKWARPFAPMGWTPPPRDPADVLHVGDVVLVRVLREEVVHAKVGKPTDDADVPPPPVQSRTLVVGLEQVPAVQGALVAIDPHRHAVLALVGGYDFARSSFDRATQARRQPGSAFKPIVYAAGLASGRYTPATLLTDAPRVYRDQGKAWKPGNYDGTFRGDITLRQCLTHSVNMCSIQIVDEVGVDAVLALATALGIRSPLPRSLTLALGAGDVTPLELTNAYATFAAGGRYQDPVLVERVKDPAGEVLREASFEQREALDPDVAYVLVHLMRSVVEEGTAQKAKTLDRPIAGKTGTSNEQRNAWFIGFTPDLVAGVYVGFDDNAPLGRSEYGSRAALPIWIDFVEQATRGQPIRDFPAPDGVVFARIHQQSGLLAAPGDPEAVDEVFVEGSEPTRQHAEAAAPPPLFLNEGVEGP